MDRKLATIRTVSEIVPIAGADMIEGVKIDGWQTVVGKSTFSVNDKCVFFEVDSIIPPGNSRYEFLRKSCYRETNWYKGFRIKTCRLRKFLSQGVAMPLSDFPELSDANVGDDVTEKLGVILYDPPVAPELQGYSRGGFPSVFPKTDQERLQNHMEYLTLYKDVMFEITEKIDGTSSSFYLLNNEYGVCSKNINFKMDGCNITNKYVQTGEQFMMEKVLRCVDEKFKLGDIMFQGEIYGNGIQKNRLRIEGTDFRVYNIYSTRLARYLDHDERYDVMEHVRNTVNPCLKSVPMIGIFKFFDMCDKIEKALAYAERKSLITPSCEMEGIVCKSKVLDNGWMIQFKVLSNRYLLKEE